MGTEKRSLMVKMANKFDMEAETFQATLKGTIMKPGKDGKPIPDAEVAAFLIVADQYGLNPFTREIYAFPDKKGGIVPVVGVDGWLNLINSHQEADGMEIRWAPEITTPNGGHDCPAWCEVIMYRKDRSHPIVVREYLDEVYRPPFEGTSSNGKKYTVDGPWQSHTKRMLRHKAIIQAGRIAFGFSGIYDEDEAARIVEQQERDMGEVVEVKKSDTVHAKSDPKSKSRRPDPEPTLEPAGDEPEYSPVTEAIESMGRINDPGELTTWYNDPDVKSEVECWTGDEQTMFAEAYQNRLNELMAAAEDGKLL